MQCPRLGRGLINGSQPQPDGFKLDKSKEIGGKLVVARRNPTTLFDLVEEPLDPVAGAGEMRAEADRIAALTGQKRTSTGRRSSLNPSKMTRNGHRSGRAGTILARSAPF
jgi:hypothetical protein